MKPLGTKQDELYDILLEQIKLLSDWNKEHILMNPGQAAKNVEVICYALHCVSL